MNYAEDLKRNIISAYPMYDAPRVIHGKYEDEIVGCLHDKYGYNVFLYIEPHGFVKGHPTRTSESQCVAALMKIYQKLTLKA